MQAHLVAPTLLNREAYKKKWSIGGRKEISCSGRRSKKRGEVSGFTAILYIFPSRGVGKRGDPEVNGHPRTGERATIVSGGPASQLYLAFAEKTSEAGPLAEPLPQVRRTREAIEGVESDHRHGRGGGGKSQEKCRLVGEKRGERGRSTNFSCV